MKTFFCLVTIMLFLGTAHANDVSCQVNVLKPKLSATSIKAESDKPAKITVTEARLRLSQSTEKNKQETVQTDSQTEEKDINDEPVEKESGLGNMFDILLPAKLRNPVQ